VKLGSFFIYLLIYDSVFASVTSLGRSGSGNCRVFL